MESSEGPQIVSPIDRGRTPARLRVGLALENTFLWGNLSVEGLDHLSEIPKGRPVVIAPSHISDYDVAMAAHSLGGRFDLGIVQVSKFSESSLEALPAYLQTLLAGRGNFSPLPFSLRGGEWNPGIIRHKTYANMVDSINRGKTMVIAAHNATYDHQLPPRGGVAPIILAQLANAVILPVAVDLKVADELVGSSGAGAMSRLAKDFIKGNRPDARVCIAKPMDLAGIDGLDGWLKNEPGIDSGVVKELIRDQSRQVMREIAKMLPKNKQGLWGK